MMTMMDDNTVGGSKLMMTGMSTTIDSSNVYVRGNLFDLSTPGLTPINPSGIANTTVTSDISMINPRPFGGLNDDTDTNNYTNTSKRINTNATSATNVTGGAVPPLPSSSSSSSSYVLKPIADSGRRVSFGPTARLSFSNVDNSSYAFDNSIADDEDEHPMKLQKMGLSHIDDIALTPANDTSIDHQKWNTTTTNSIRKDGAGLGLLDETTKTDNKTDNNTYSNSNNNDNTDSPLRAISLIAILATAYQYLCNYKCRDCIRYYHHYHYYYYYHYYHYTTTPLPLPLPLLPLAYYINYHVVILHVDGYNKC